MWAIYGKSIPTPVVVNIGPGMPDEEDLHQLARRFSWPRSNNHEKRSSIVSKVQAHLKRSSQCYEATTAPALPKKFAAPSNPPSPEKPDISHQTLPPKSSGTKTTIHMSDRKCSLAVLEDRIEEVIRNLLGNPENQMYFRLALDTSPKGTSQNDAWAGNVPYDATMLYLGQENVAIIFDDPRKLIPPNGWTAAPAA